MSERGDDFIWVKTTGGVTDLNFHEGLVHIRVAGSGPARILKSDWALAQRRGLPLELTTPPSAARTQKEA